MVIRIVLVLVFEFKILSSEHMHFHVSGRFQGHSGTRLNMHTKSSLHSSPTLSHHPSHSGLGIMLASPHNWWRRSSSHMLLNVQNTFALLPFERKQPSRPYKSASCVQSPLVKWWHLTQSKSLACSNE